MSIIKQTNSLYTVILFQNLLTAVSKQRLIELACAVERFNRAFFRNSGREKQLLMQKNKQMKREKEKNELSSRLIQLSEINKHQASVNIPLRTVTMTEHK